MKIRVNSHHGGKRTHRSAAEEWQPHRPQGDRSAEWWALTAEGLAQDSADRGHSFWYSLPRLRITGSVTYTDERGKPIAVDVSGSGWADREWGDFPTAPWPEAQANQTPWPEAQANQTPRPEAQANSARPGRPG